LNIAKLNKGPLFGLRIVEFEGIGPAPLAGQLLSDLGAQVVKIERGNREKSSTNILDRSKSTITLDLKSPGGNKIARKLISKADALIEGFRPGVMERLGLGPKDCEKINPGLVYGRITGWGQDGPYSQKAGHDINYLSITGALNAIGLKSQPPIPPLNLLADYAGGTMFLILGILSALWEKSHSKKGQVIDAAMVEGVPALMGLIHSYIAENKWTNEREENLLDGGCPYYRCYETKDGNYVSVGALENKFFAILVEKLGLKLDWVTEQTNKQKWPELTEELKNIFITRTRKEWGKIFEGTDACVEPVLNWEEVENHPQNKDRNIFFKKNGVLQANTAPKFSRTSANDLPDTDNIQKSLQDILREWQINGDSH